MLDVSKFKFHQQKKLGFLVYTKFPLKLIFKLKI